MNDWLCDDSDERDMFGLEWSKMQREFNVLGFREGMSDGEERGLQDGFNKGFKAGSAIAMEWGQLQGITTSLLAFFAKVSKRQDAGLARDAPVQLAVDTAARLQALNVRVESDAAYGGNGETLPGVLSSDDSSRQGHANEGCGKPLTVVRAVGKAMGRGEEALL